MKRWLIRICVFLFLGAIVNVAVAWFAGFSAQRPTGTAGQRLADDEAEQLWNSYVDGARRYGFAGWREARLFSTMTEFGDCYIIDDDGTMLGIDNAICTGVFIVDSGLPCRVLSHTSQWGLAASKVRFATRLIDRDSLTWLKEARPIWPGFAINTVFYAVVMWLLFAGPFVVRRWRRIRRGLCPKCAYDLRGAESEACPECGAAVNRIAR